MRVFIFFSALFSLSCWAHAQQDSSGVYLSMGDFKCQKLAYAINCKTQKHKIKLSDFSNNEYIKVIHNDSLYTLLKNEIFGYRDCKGNSYRFIEGKNYAILNPDEYILLYKHEIRQPNRTGVHYLFSRGANSTPLKLTKGNLKSVFSDNVEFQKKVDQVFERDAQLVRYDKDYKMYLVNWLYGQVKQ